MKSTQASSNRARRAAQQTPGTNNAYSGTQEPSANNSLSMQSPGFKNGGSFLGSDSKGGLRNQTSANVSSLKQNGHLNGAGNSNSTANGHHLSGSQRIRDKLLINSGGLALNSNTNHAANALLMTKNGQNQKSPPGSGIGMRYQSLHQQQIQNKNQIAEGEKEIKNLINTLHQTNGTTNASTNPSQSNNTNLINASVASSHSVTEVNGTPNPGKNNKLSNNSLATPTGAMSHQMTGGKSRLITTSNAKGNSMVRQNTYGQQSMQQPSQRNNSVPFSLQNQRNNGGVRRFNNPTPAPPKRRIENLPRTGIEYPIMKLPQQFITQHKEHEPLSEKPCPQHIVDEYVANDAERANQPIPQSSVVYDSVEMSSYYDNSINDLYIDERELIELPAPHQQGEGQINEPYQKRYYFNPMNLPYNLEQSQNYSAKQLPVGEKASGSMGDKKGPRLNRYYETLKPYYKLKDLPDGDKTLVFESRFESANLRKAVKISDYEYDLYLKNDYGTNGFTQWYFFRVQNTRKDKVYRFNIVNLMKPDSNYNQGMKPLIYSVKEAELNKVGWSRDGFNIAYYQSARKKRAGNAAGSAGVLGSLASASTASSMPTGPANCSGYGPLYYALSFEIIFAHDDDTVFLAHCYPFTYSDQCEFIRKVCTFQNKDKIRKTVLCKSLAGNDVDMLIVTNFLSDPVDIAVRKSIILSSRVHPGESNASFVMNGVIDFLVSDDDQAQFLRNTFVFKVVPMLNPDGVIVGNYRCSLMGQDLNRQWIGSSSKFYPINYHTKLMMKRTLESRDIFFFCDFHGHSTGRNVFMFGNNQTKPQERNKEKIFPLLFSENIDMFGFEDCSFAVQKSRESTARIVMWREFQLVNSFTLEASFLGPNKGVHAGLHFNPTMLQIMGRVFCKTLVDYVDNQERVNRVFAELKNRFPQGGGCVRASNQYNNKTDEEKDF